MTAHDFLIVVMLSLGVILFGLAAVKGIRRNKAAFSGELALGTWTRRKTPNRFWLAVLWNVMWAILCGLLILKVVHLK